MKKNLLGVSLIAVTMLFSCTSKKSTDETPANSSTTVAGSETSAPTNNNTTTPAMAVNVPPKAKESFQTKYPNAANATWKNYDPNYEYPFDWEWTGWPRVDTSYYTATYNADGGDYWVFYTPEGEWMSTVEPIKSDKVPDAVNKVLNAKYKAYTVESVSKENDKNREAYEIKMKNGEDKMKVLIDKNGNIMKSKGRVDGEKVKEKNV